MTLDLRSRRGGALVAASVVVVAVVAVVAVFGLVPYPDVPTLADQPDPPVTGQLAYITYGSSQRQPCLHVVDGLGEDGQLVCGSAYGGALHWIDEGRLGVADFRGAAAAISVIDAATGEVIDTMPEDRDRDEPFPTGVDPENDDGDVLLIGEEDDRVWLDARRADGRTDRLLELEGPASYTLYDAGWTADGRWAVVQDSQQRLLVVDAEGTAPARVWATDVSSTAVR
ncbi:hypothetical protein BH23ACT9_BH23ACT9_02430 [soil metagenome]